VLLACFPGVWHQFKTDAIIYLVCYQLKVLVRCLSPAAGLSVHASAQRVL